MALERQDIATDDALRVIPELTDQLTTLLQTIDTVRGSSKSFSDGLSAAPLPKLKTDTEGLTQAQVELAKVQNQISVVVAKNNDVWVANQQVLKNAKDELKNSQATADSWTKSVTAQNSSIIQLNDALNKNRIAYSNLRTESDRHSKSGQDLLKVIQTQDKSFKELSLTMGQAQASVGGYRQAIEQAAPILGLGSQKIAQAAAEAGNLAEKLEIAHPIIALVSAAFAVAAIGVTEFFKRTEEGGLKQRETVEVLSSTWGVFAELLSKIGSNVYDFTLGPLTKFIASLTDEGQDAIYVAQGLEEIEKRTIENIVERSKVQLEADKLMFEARDKLNNSDIKRLEAAKKADAMLKEQSEVNIKLLRDEFELRAAVIRQRYADPSLDIQKAQAELQVKINEAEDSYFQGSRRRQALIISIDREILDRRIANEKEYTDTTIINAETRLKASMREDKLIIASSDSTLEDRLKAQKQYNEDEIRLIGVTASKEIETLRSTAQTRIVAAGGDAAEVVAIKKGFIDKETAILAKAQEDQFAILEKGKQDQAKLIIEDSVYFIALKKRFADETKTADLKNLNETFEEGKFTLLQYETKKAEILRGGSDLDISILKQSYIDELNLLQKKIDTDITLVQVEKDKVLGIIASLQKEILKLDEDGNIQLIRSKKAVNQELLALQHELFASTVAVGDNLFKAQQDQSNAHLQMLNNDKNTELQLAGNNANAKMLIEHEYGIKIREEEKKLRRSQHDQAVFDRDIAAVQIAVNIAEGIAKIWGEGYPYPVAIGLTAIVAAIGAAQEIAVLSKPIPAYEKGTDYHRGGAAMVAERGAEWVIEPGQAPRLYDVPNTVIPNLAIGSKVLTADETQAIERQILNSSFRGQISNDNQPIIINDNSDVVEAVNGIRLPSVVAQGRELMEVWESRNGSKKWIQSKIFW